MTSISLCRPNQEGKGGSSMPPINGKKVGKNRKTTDHTTSEHENINESSSPEGMNTSLCAVDMQQSCRYSDCCLKVLTFVPKLTLPVSLLCYIISQRHICWKDEKLQAYDHYDLNRYPCDQSNVLIAGEKVFIYNCIFNRKSTPSTVQPIKEKTS